MRSSVRRAGVLLAGLALAGVGATAGATAASAGQFQSITTKRGWINFDPSGDKVRVGDTKKDGISIRGYYKGEAQAEHILEVGGYGKTKTRTFNQPEGQKVWIQLCYRKGSTITKCSKWQRGRA